MTALRQTAVAILLAAGLAAGLTGCNTKSGTVHPVGRPVQYEPAPVHEG